MPDTDPFQYCDPYEYFPDCPQLRQDILEGQRQELVEKYTSYYASMPALRLLDHVDDIDMVLSLVSPAARNEVFSVWRAECVKSAVKSDMGDAA